MCLLKIPNEISNINSFATGEMFRDVSNKRYKGNSISRQQQNYWKKYTGDSVSSVSLFKKKFENRLAVVKKPRAYVVEIQ